MLNKINIFVFAVIMTIIFTVVSSVNVWADTPAGDEQETLTNYLPDALILFDLSGSMAQNPAGTAYPYGSDTSCVGNTTLCNNPTDTTFVYSDDSTCTPDIVNCAGSTSSTYIYGHDADCTANSTAGACVGAPTSTYYYAYDKSCTANTSKCTSKSGTTCSGGFCNGTGQGNCVTNCSNNIGKYGYCSGGFCGTSGKTGCSQKCWCKDGMCQSPKNNCTNQCATNKCDAINGFCNDQSQTDCQTNCSKLAIAKRALFSILDDDNSNTIDINDATSLGIRIGYMRYYNCSADESNSYTSGCNTLIDTISTLGSNSQTSYQLTYCGNSTSCASTVTGCSSGSCIAGESATGGTPLAGAEKEAKLYLDAHKAADTYGACRQKFVILLTDGSDTYACSGNGSDCQSKMYARRREVVAATKQLADAGYKVFVVGFGSQMPDYLQSTLNWMAFYGGTDNPLVANVPTKPQTLYNIPLGCTATPAVPSACCNLSTNATACFPSGITSGQTDSSTITNSDCGSSQSGFQATYNDPGYISLSGYAFIAGDADTLTAALKSAISTIKEASYSFTHASIQAQRTTSENYLYEASFEPLTSDPFWIGHLKRFGLATDATGAINAASDWDAGAVLQSVVDDGTSSPRKIYTTNGTSSTLQPFNTSLTAAMFGAADDATKNNIIKFIRRGDYAYTTGTPYKNWKLGDILHTSPVVVPTPNSNFYDGADTNKPPLATSAYDVYTSYHQRTSDASGTRIVVVGANDGQLHAFKTYDGSEAWSFIPPNLLSRLSLMTHPAHPTSLNHTYFVDGPIGAAEIWLKGGWPSESFASHSATAIDTTTKIGHDVSGSSEWKTLMVLSEGRGGASNLWSSSTGCDSGFSPSNLYSSTYNNYCGYYALDITNTTAVPTFQWRLGGTSGLTSGSTGNGAEYLGQPWSRMFFWRVRINNIERWVGLIGGGYSGTNCAGGGTCSDTRGKGFFVVDASNGAILWKYTYGTTTSTTANPLMVYNLVAEPLGMDSDYDGFMDTAYIGDLGGNVWRFKFCLKSQGTTCNTNDWTGGLLFNNH